MEVLAKVIKKRQAAFKSRIEFLEDDLKEQEADNDALHERLQERDAFLWPVFNNEQIGTPDNMKAYWLLDRVKRLNQDLKSRGLPELEFNGEWHTMTWPNIVEGMIESFTRVIDRVDPSLSSLVTQILSRKRA